MSSRIVAVAALMLWSTVPVSAQAPEAARPFVLDNGLVERNAHNATSRSIKRDRAVPFR